jgi:hypothetical protein
MKLQLLLPGLLCYALFDDLLAVCLPVLQFPGTLSPLLIPLLTGSPPERKRHSVSYWSLVYRKRSDQDMEYYPV